MMSPASVSVFRSCSAGMAVLGKMADTSSLDSLCGGLETDSGSVVRQEGGRLRAAYVPSVSLRRFCWSWSFIGALCQYLVVLTVTFPYIHTTHTHTHMHTHIFAHTQTVTFALAVVTYKCSIIDVI